MPKNALRDTSNKQRKMCLSLQHVATPCVNDHQIPLEGYETTVELCAVCEQIVLIYYGQLNTLARSATKRNKACDKRLLRLIN